MPETFNPYELHKVDLHEVRKAEFLHEVRKAQVAAFIRERGKILLHELWRLGDWTLGEVCWHSPLAPNLIIWANLSEELYHILAELINEGKVMPKLCKPRLYAEDGISLSYNGQPLPVAERLRVSTPHWLPIYLKWVGD